VGDAMTNIKLEETHQLEKEWGTPEGTQLTIDMEINDRSNFHKLTDQLKTALTLKLEIMDLSTSPPTTKTIIRSRPSTDIPWQICLQIATHSSPISATPSVYNDQDLIMFTQDEAQTYKKIIVNTVIRRIEVDTESHGALRTIYPYEHAPPEVFNKGPTYRLHKANSITATIDRSLWEISSKGRQA